MMSSVAAESKLQQAVSLQGVDPETCMIVFKNHWAQVMYEFRLLCWSRGLHHTEPGLPTSAAGNRASRNRGRKTPSDRKKSNSLLAFLEKVSG